MDKWIFTVALIISFRDLCDTIIKIALILSRSNPDTMDAILDNKNLFKFSPSKLFSVVKAIYELFE